MADVKISALPVAGTIVPSTNVLPVVNGGLTTKATVNELVNSTLVAPGAIGGTTPNTGTFTRITTTNAGSATPGLGQVYLNGATSNRIDYAAVGVAAPTYTTKSAGTKITLYPAVSGTSADYALGIAAGTLWSSIPGNDAGQFFKWYGGTTQVASLSGTGVFKLTGDILPTTDNTQSLGSSLLRWNSVHVGPGSLFLQDTNNAGLNAELTVTDGVLLINGANQLEAPTVRLTTLTGTSTSTAFSLGVSGDTGAINVYRDINVPTKNISVGDLYLAGGSLPFISTNNDQPLNIQANSVTINDSTSVGAVTVDDGGVAISASVNTGVTVSDTKIRLFGAAVPAHSYGSLGDTEGLVAFDGTYMYYCTAQYRNTSTNIWKRVAWSAGTW